MCLESGLEGVASLGVVRSAINVIVRVGLGEVASTGRVLLEDSFSWVATLVPVTKLSSPIFPVSESLGFLRGDYCN